MVGGERKNKTVSAGMDFARYFAWKGYPISIEAASGRYGFAHCARTGAWQAMGF